MFSVYFLNNKTSASGTFNYITRIFIGMADWVRPVEHVGDVVVVGERHRKRSSRQLVASVLEDYDIDGVCVEVSPETGYRDDGGGAIGKALVWATHEDIPRYYVDESKEDVIDGFGNRWTAIKYLRSIENRDPVHEAGLIDREMCSTVRTEIRDRYGENAVNLVLENREEKMAGRAKWVSEQVDSNVLLVVGGAHFDAIVDLLENGVNPIHVGDSRVRNNERVAPNFEMAAMILIMVRNLKQIDLPSRAEIWNRWKRS